MEIADKQLQNYILTLQPTIISLLFILFVYSISDSAETKDLIAVMDLTSDGTVSRSAIDSICEKICQTISADGNYELFDRKFLPVTLQSVGHPEHPRCSDDLCLINIGKDIGTKYIIGGSIRKSKTGFYIRLNLVNSESGKSVGTVSKRSNDSKSVFIKQKVPSLVNDLLLSGKEQAKSDAADSASVNEATPAIVTQSKPTADEKQFSIENQSSVHTKADIPSPQQLAVPDRIIAADSKPRIVSETAGSTMSAKKNKKHSPLILIGTSVVAAVGAATAVYYYKFKGMGSSAGGETDLSIVDAPNHSQ